MNHIEIQKEFYKQLTVKELVFLRYDAIRLDDKETKKLIDEELNRRTDK